MRTQRRMCSTWMKLASVGISKPITRWQPISWKAGRSTKSASLLPFVQTQTAVKRFRWRSWANIWIHVVSKVLTAICWAPIIMPMQSRGWPRTSFDSGYWTLITGCKVAKSSFCWTTARATSPWRSLRRWTWSFATPAFFTCRQTWPR
jgi:hypothetical protein